MSGDCSSSATISDRVLWSNPRRSTVSYNIPGVSEDKIQTILYIISLLVTTIFSLTDSQSDLVPSSDIVLVTLGVNPASNVGTLLLQSNHQV